TRSKRDWSSDVCSSDLLDLMAASTDQIAIWILMALKEEWERDPSHLTCRIESVVLGPLKSKHKIEDADITRGIRFLVDHRMLDRSEEHTSELQSRFDLV